MQGAPRTITLTMSAIFSLSFSLRVCARACVCVCVCVRACLCMCVPLLWGLWQRGTPSPPCSSHALVQAIVGVGTILIWYLILIWYQM